MSEREVHVHLKLDTAQFTAGMRRAAEAAGKVAHRFTLAFTPTAQRRKHKRRCRICSPFANPRPLAINGHAYHQRSKNRRKR